MPFHPRANPRLAIYIMTMAPMLADLVDGLKDFRFGVPITVKTIAMYIIAMY